MLPANERKYLHAILSTGAELAEIEKLESFFGSFAVAWNADMGELCEAGLSAERASSIVNAAASRNPDTELRKLVSFGISLVTLGDADFPEELVTIASPPRFLYIKGSIPKDIPRLAIVGTRKASQYGLAVTRKIIHDLADRIEITIVSGLALGIDAEAHRAAIDYALPTIGILGGGIDRASFYPPSNFGLSEAIAKRGAVVSEYPPGTPGLRHHFIARNRLIAGISLGTLVIEAPEKSGALITANFALEQGREVFAIPGQFFSETGAGVNHLIQNGAKLVSRADDILDELGLEAKRSDHSARTETADSVEEKILSLLGEAMSVDNLKRATGLETSVIMTALSALELSGRIRPMGNATFQKIT